MIYIKSTESPKIMKKSEKVMNAKGRSLGSTYLLVTEGGRENKNTQKDEESLRTQEGREWGRYMALGGCAEGPLSLAE